MKKIAALAMAQPVYTRRASLDRVLHTSRKRGCLQQLSIEPNSANYSQLQELMQ